MRKVKVPINMADRAMGLLMKAGDRIWRDTEKQCREWHVTANQYNMLRILNGAGEPLSQIEISRRLISSRANVTKLIDVLEKQGLVRRNSCKDRRMNLIELTEKGSQFLEGTLHSARRYAEKEMNGLSREEQRQLFGLLEKLL